MSPLRVYDIVDRVRRRVQRLALLTELLWFAAAWGVVLVVAWLWAGPEGWSQGSPGPLVLDVGLLAIVLLAVSFFVGLRNRWLNDVRVSECLDDAAELHAGTVLGSLELSRELPVGASKSLAEFAEQSVVRRLDLPDERLAGPMARQAAGWARRALVGLALVVPLLVALAVLTPQRWRAAVTGLASPVRLLAALVLPPLAVEPGDAEVLRGTSVQVVVTAPGRESVTLHWQSAGEVAQRLDQPVSDAMSSSFALTRVHSVTRYWASAPDGARTSEYEIVPIDPLFVGDVIVAVVFPPHTSRPPEEYRSDVPPLTVPVGTRLDIQGRASRPLAEAELRRVGSDEHHVLDLDVEGFSTRWTAAVGGLWDWYFVDLQSAPAEVRPGPIELTLLPDSAPSVRFTVPAADTVLPVSLRQPLVLEASDDYGLTSLELVTYRVSAAGERFEPIVQGLALGGTRGALARPVLDVSAWDLLPGDQVRYLARATDNAPRPQTTETREWVLRMPAAAEIRRGAQTTLEEAARRAEGLAEQARRFAEETRDLERLSAADQSRQGTNRAPLQRRDGERSETAGFERREDLRQAVERQQGLTAELDSLREELRALSESMREAGLSAPEFRSDLEELQRLLREMTTAEMREQLDEIARNLDQLGARQARETLRELAESQDDLRERIEQSLERFRRAAVQQDFRATTAEAEELAREEQALAEAMREEGAGAQPELRADQQAGLEARAEEVEGRMDELEDQLTELGELEAAERVQRAGERTSEARSEMATARRQSRAGEPRRASESAREAATEMDEAARQLREAQREMAEQQIEAMRQAMEQAASDALSLARQQTDAREQMRGANQDRRSDLRGDVQAVLQGLRNMADNLAAASQMAGSPDRKVSERMGEAMSALEQSLEAMGERPGTTPSPLVAAEDAIEALNGVALQAMEAARQAGQGSQGQSAADQMGEQLESLAQQQGQLNNQSGQIMPMQLGEQALQSMLQQIAQGQEGIAGELDQMSQQPGAEGPLGDLEALAAEAQELAQELAGGRLDAPTRERQDRLFHRLLDAGRSLEKDDELSDERESETAGRVERGSVPFLSAEDIGAMKFSLPEAALLQRLSPAELQLVLKYFERLNRDVGRPAPGAGTGAGR